VIVYEGKPPGTKKGFTTVDWRWISDIAELVGAMYLQVVQRCKPGDSFFRIIAFPYPLRIKIVTAQENM
jgi:hypothetical protein